MSGSPACWALIPVKESALGKSRLAGTLDPAERARLVSAMLGHVVDTASAAQGVARVLLVGPSRHGLEENIALLPDPGQGLNPALASALALIAADGAAPGGAAPGGAAPGRLVVLAGDLPRLTARDVELMALAPPGSIAIAPDRHGVGTNALSLPLPAAASFRFAFGTDSFARHRREAGRLGLPVEVVISPGLERDVDEPADLPDAGEMLAE